MSNSLTASTPKRGEPPDAPRHRAPWRRLGDLLALASALALAIAMMAAPPPAQAVTNIDGQWTVTHGGTGQLILYGDHTFTSTCQAYIDYPDAWCPAPSGTFIKGADWVEFHAADGTYASYRISGLVFSPDAITSMFGSRTSSPLEMTKGGAFVCTDWILTTRYGSSSPLVYHDADGNLHATGSGELLIGSDLAETAPNYFQNGACADFPSPPPAPTVHIDSVRDASIPADTAGQWLAQAVVTIKDAAGAPVAGAIASGTFSSAPGRSCITVADGTCTVSAQSTYSNSKGYDSFQANFLIKDGMQWDGLAIYIDVLRPAGLTPTYHIGDLDNATSTTSGSTWEPKVTAEVFDSAGVLVEGATVYGTFTNQIGGSACTTGADGTCTVGDFTLSSSSTSTVFTMISVIKSSSAYAPSANTDPDGDSNGTAITITKPDSTTPTPTPTPEMVHVGDLDNATTASSSRSKWQPKATATVLDSNGMAVEGATVSGTFTSNSGTLTCTTAASGTCTLGNFSLSRSTTGTVFTVTSVVKAASTYAPAANSDPDGDSNGTSLTITRP